MRNSNEQPLSEVIKKLLDTYRLKDGVNAVKVKNAWEELMGKGIQHRTSSVNLKNKVLYICVSSSVLRQELEYKKDEIIKALNDVLKEDAIREVIIR
jgi:hypothetical protein